jgi:uncharacterized Zn finger protein
MTCSRCSGLMVEDQFFDFEGTQGFMSMECWRCMNCGHAQDAVGAQHQLARQKPVVVLARGESDTQDEVVYLGAAAFIRRAA